MEILVPAFYLALQFFWFNSLFKTTLEGVQQVGWKRKFFFALLFLAPLCLEYVRLKSYYDHQFFWFLGYLFFLVFVSLVVQGIRREQQSLAVNGFLLLILGIPFFGSFQWQSIHADWLGNKIRYDHLIVANLLFFYFPILDIDRRDWKFKPASSKTVLSIYLYGVSTVFVLGVITEYFSFAPPDFTFSNFLKWFLVLFHWILIQEFYFRRALQKVLVSTLDQAFWFTGILAAAILYGSSQYLVSKSWGHFTVAVTVGIFTGILLHRTGNIFHAWGFHALVSTIGFVFFGKILF